MPGRLHWGMFAALGAGTWFAWGSREFCLDDAYIHLAYAKSLRLGDGLSYNPHDLETGFSSPLWVLLLALMPVEASPHVLVKALGVVLHAACAGLAGYLVARFTTSNAANEPGRGPSTSLSSALTALLVALQPGLLQAAVSGMEVSLAALLCLLVMLATFSRRPIWAGVLAGLATLARPECLVFTAMLGACTCMLGRRAGGGVGGGNSDAGESASRAERGSSAGPGAFRVGSLLACAAPAIGGGSALGAWCGYNALVSGYPFPNTHYVKSAVALSTGLSALFERAFLHTSWFAGLGGIALAVAALATGPVRGRRLALAWFAAVAFTAFSRKLDPRSLFFADRYFLVFAPIPWVLVGAGMLRVPRALGLLACGPVALLSLVALPAARERLAAQERDIAETHTAVARYVARTLPPRSTVMVEGAGALRYYTPRTMRIVDMLGLNDHAIAHTLQDPFRRGCTYLSRSPQYLAFPLDMRAPLESVFGGGVIRTFVREGYAQEVVPHRRTVVLVGVNAVQPGFASRCQAAGVRPSQ